MTDEAMVHRNVLQGITLSLKQAREDLERAERRFAGADWLPSVVALSVRNATHEVEAALDFVAEGREYIRKADLKRERPDA